MLACDGRIAVCDGFLRYYLELRRGEGESVVVAHDGGIADARIVESASDGGGNL